MLAVRGSLVLSGNSRATDLSSVAELLCDLG